MINFDPNANSILANLKAVTQQAEGAAGNSGQFAETVKAVGQYVSKVDDLQAESDTSIQDLLTGKNNDITSVVSSVAKADASFKVLLGVRNKLIEAYKQTMNMQI